MDVHRVLDYQAGPDAVFAMLCDQKFREQVCQETRASEYDVRITERGEGAEIRVRRVFPALVPDIAKRFVGDTIEMIQTETWSAPAADGRRTAELRMEIPRQPGHVTGAITLDPVGDGARETIDAHIKVTIPLVGGKLAEQVARGIKAGIKVEWQLGQDWLADT